MTEVLVLDVGHGNCAIVKRAGAAIVVDAPLGPLAVRALRQEGIDQVAVAFASHTDADHLGGLMSLLQAPDIVVHEVRCNPDATRRTAFWDDFKVVVRIAKESRGTRLRTELTTETSSDLSFDDVSIDVLYPPADLAVSGVGGLRSGGGRISANSMSAVLRVVVDGEPLVLLTGDLEISGLQRLIEDGTDLRAKALVFPHHGGLPGSRTSAADLRGFARTLAQEVQPETTVFSIGRNKFRNPQPAIVEGMREGAPSAHIACTQLSMHCSDEALGSDSHLAARFAAGREKGLCCAGTIVLRQAGSPDPARDAHEAAIVPLTSRLCRPGSKSPMPSAPRTPPT